MFYIESKGFSATTWLSRQLSKHPDIHCYHSTRAIPQQGAIGSPNDLSVDKFVEALSKEERAGSITGAIHALFDIEAGALVRNAGGVYALAVRHPVSRVNSCFSWAKTKFFKKREYFSLSRDTVGLSHHIHGPKVGLEDMLFTFSCFHILQDDYYFGGHYQHLDYVYRMEDYTQDAQSLGQIFHDVTKGRVQPDPVWLVSLITGTASEKNLHSGSGHDPVEEVYASWPLPYQRTFNHLFRMRPELFEAYQRLGYDLSWLATALKKGGHS